MPGDLYAGFDALFAVQRRDRDYRITVKQRLSPVAVIAPHGGGIEQGTSEIAAAIADDDLSLYDFHGLKKDDNHVLHITSARFDEPECLGLLRTAKVVLTIHGANREDKVAYIGGLDESLMGALKECITEAGYDARRETDVRLTGTNPNNICNRGQGGCGAQLEIGAGLRRTFFASLRREGRNHPTPALNAFAGAVRAALRVRLERAG
jgi:phage replication-related protein YjqB (UPF0714/DUF867 family)